MFDVMFSIIVPVYNREKCVSTAIDSVLTQDFEDFELLIIDDGSSDGTAAICRQYEHLDCRVHYFFQKNAGVSAARNVGLKEAKGKYILFLDSDDYYESNSLKTIYSLVQHFHFPDLIVYGNTSPNGGGYCPSERIVGRIICRDELKKNIIPAFLNLYPKGHHEIMPFIHNKCYKKDSIRGINFDESYKTWEDGIFNDEVLKYTESMVCIQNKLYVLSDGGYKWSSHLAQKYFSNMIDNWISYFELCRSKYGFEYDFTSEYIREVNWKVLYELLNIAYKNGDKKAIMYSIGNKTVNEWLVSYSNANLIEKIAIKAYVKRDINMLFLCLGFNRNRDFLQNGIRKIAMVLKKLPQ